MSTSVNNLYQFMIDAGFDPSVDLTGLSYAEIHPVLIFTLNTITEHSWVRSFDTRIFNNVDFAYLACKENQQPGQVIIRDWKQLVTVITKLNISNPNAIITWEHKYWPITSFPFVELLPSDPNHVGLVHYSRNYATRQLPRLREYARLLTLMMKYNHHPQTILHYAYQFYVGAQFDPRFSTLYLAESEWFADIDELYRRYSGFDIMSQLRDCFPSTRVSIKILVLPRPSGIPHNQHRTITVEESSNEESKELHLSDPSESASSPNSLGSTFPDEDLHYEFRQFLKNKNVHQKDCATDLNISQATLSTYMTKKHRTTGWTKIENAIRLWMTSYQPQNCKPSNVKYHFK